MKSVNAGIYPVCPELSLPRTLTLSSWPLSVCNRTDLFHRSVQEDGLRAVAKGIPRDRSQLLLEYVAIQVSVSEALPVSPISSLVMVDIVCALATHSTVSCSN
jgi:hypothetical protein